MKTNLLSILLTVIILSATGSLQAQSIIKGTVTTENQENDPVTFADVLLFRLPDMEQPSSNVVTTEKGGYTFENVSNGDYLIHISALGYHPFVSDTIQISTAGELTLDYKLQVSAVSIDAIAVEGTSIKQDLDRTVFEITKKDTQFAKTGLQLMTKVPQLTLNPVTQKLSSNDGAVRVYINGATSSEQELKALQSEDIKSIEYYNIPPTRYGGGSGSVINVITKDMVSGLYGGIDLSHAVNAEFFDDSAYIKYNKGRSQIMMNYYGSYRNYYDIDVNLDYDFTFKAVDHKREQTNRRKFGYFYNNLNINYTNQLQDKYILQINLTPNIMTSHDNNEKNITMMSGDVINTRYGKSESTTSTFSPSLDIYFWKQLREQQEIVLNLQGTYHDAFSKYRTTEYSETTDQPEFSDFQNTFNNKYSAYGQAIYIKKFKSLSLSIGDNINFEDLNSKIGNSFADGTYDTKVLSNYLYGDITGKIKKFQYKVSLGVSSRYTKNKELDEWSWVFQPQIDLGYMITNTFSLRAGFYQYNTNPSLGQLSNKISFISDNIISRNNPYLKSGYSNSSYFQIGYYGNKISVFGTLAYGYQKNPISQYYVEGEEYMELITENADYSNSYSAKAYVKLSPFKNQLFELTLSGGFNRNTYQSKFTGSTSHNSFPLYYYLTFNYKNVSAYYQGALKTFYLDAPYLTQNETQSHIGVSYRYKNFQFNASCYWFIISPEAISKTVPGSVVRTYQRQVIKDNHNMVVLGISYNFGKGRVYQDVQRQANKDSDAGLK